MKMIYIANHRLPTEKAYGIQMAKMAEAFSGLGIKITLVAPFRLSRERGSVFKYYGLKRSFKFKRIWTPDFYLPGRLDKIAFHIKSFISAFILAFYALTNEPDIVFSRDEMPLYLLSFFCDGLIFEAHKFSEKRFFFYKRFKKVKIKIIAISGGIKKELEKFGFDPNNILVAFDAVDLEDFDIKASKSKAREKLNLPLDKKIALYSGHFFKWKGVDTLIEAAMLLKEVFFVFIGGTEKDIKEFKSLVKDKKLDNVLFLGHKPYREVPWYLKAADVLVLPNKKEEKISELYTSPLKLFEYMASKRPIVASDLPSISEVLDEETAVFFEPDNPKQLVESIKKVIQSGDLAETISAKAFERVKNYTWGKRVERILEFIR